MVKNSDYKVQNILIAFSCIISIAALGLSYYAFSFSNLEERHKLKVCFAPINVRKTPDTIYIKHRAIFQNYGNRPEAILYSSFYYTDPEKERGTNDEIIDSSFTINAGEMVIRDYMTFICRCNPVVQEAKSFLIGLFTFNCIYPDNVNQTQEIIIGAFDFKSTEVQFKNSEDFYKNHTLVEY